MEIRQIKKLVEIYQSTYSKGEDEFVKTLKESLLPYTDIDELRTLLHTDNWYKVEEYLGNEYRDEILDAFECAVCEYYDILEVCEILY